MLFKWPLHDMRASWHALSIGGTSRRVGGVPTRFMHIQNMQYWLHSPHSQFWALGDSRGYHFAKLDVRHAKGFAENYDITENAEILLCFCWKRFVT